MAFISLSNVCFSYDANRVIFDKVSAVFNDAAHVAIIGDNGVGKTTLLKILSGDIIPDSGNIIRNAGVYIMHQKTAPDSKSGGERQSHELSRAFASGEQILLLDEPTNNLDTASRARFFNDLASYPFGVVVVSHDRELLQKMDTIIEIENGTLHTYGGNYDFYVRQKQAQHERLGQKYKTSGREIERLTDALAIAQTTRQHHESKQQKEIGTSRRSRLAANALKGKSRETEAKRRSQIHKKLNLQTDVRRTLGAQIQNDEIKIPLVSGDFYGRRLVWISELCFAYGDRVLFQNFTLTLSGGQRIRITGKNGVGKSTLLKIICGKLHPMSGTVKTFGKIAFLDQSLSLLDKDKSIVENIMNVSGCQKHDAHAIAANFGFRGAASARTVGRLSGGELLKATLAAVLAGRHQPDLLILDEPTNNLEIKSQEILENALNRYNGAILLVSHDEMFAQNIHIDATICLDN